MIIIPGCSLCCLLRAVCCCSSATELPNFFASTKFFSCLDLKESQELFEATQMVSTSESRSSLPLSVNSSPLSMVGTGTLTGQQHNKPRWGVQRP